MFDADGRFPMEGSLSDSLEIPLDICTVLPEDAWSRCEDLPATLRQISLLVPIGYALNPGSYESCLGSSSDIFSGKYCLIFLAGPPELSGLASDNLGKAAPSGSHNVQNLLLNHLDMLFNNPFPVPDLGNFAKIINSYNYLAAHLKDHKLRNTFNETVFSILKPEFIVKYINDLAIKEAQDISMYLNNILLALLALYSAINRPLIGLCIPSTCQEYDVNVNFLTLIQNLTIGNQSLVPSVSTLQCYTDENRTASPDKILNVDIFIYIVFATIGILILAGTILDLWDTWAFPTPVKRKSKLVKSVLSFSAYTNCLHLLSTATIGSDHLDCMNGMRFLSMTWVVLGHSFFVLMVPYSALRNIIVVPEIFSGSAGLAFEAVLTATPSVDSFFLMSGTLTAYLMFRELERANTDALKHFVTFIMYYVHRYFRLTITYALIMGAIIAVVPHVYYGPGWSYLNSEAEACRSNGWAHFLYVNTLLKDLAGEKNLCMGVTWYLVDDMLFHWFSPLVLYPMFLLWHKTRNHLASFMYWLAVMIAFTSVVAYIAYTTGQAPGTGVSSENFQTDYTYRVDFYFVPWARYQPYLVGILLGYILHHTRGKKVIINEQLNIIVWQMAFLAAFSIIYGLYNARVSMNGTLLAATFYNTFQRMVWALALSWVIFSCVKGYGGPVNEFLSWSVFAPLSRLTYCSYLFHISIINIFAASVLSTFPSDFR